jgi:formylglycine-generating enzyme required for sulfatase activity
MGSESSLDYGASPVHQVSLSTYYISHTEINWGLWDSVVTWGKNHGYNDLPNGRKGNYGNYDHPVSEVNWFDAIKWCNALSEMDGYAPVYYINNSQATIYKVGEISIDNSSVKWDANGYRLPTEAEWEFAARGGSLSKNYIYSGSDSINYVAWYFSNSDTNTHPTGTKLSNEINLYDMSGNVYEWCWDWYGKYNYMAVIDPQGSSIGSERVLRGGSFLSYYSASCRVTDRYAKSVPEMRYKEFGFRIVKRK